MVSQFQPGDCVIYRKPKYSVHPGRHARDISPALHGDSYSYHVDKYWTVISVESSGKVIVCTRRGKHHTLAPDDSALRRATWWERLLYRHCFPNPNGC